MDLKQENEAPAQLQKEVHRLGLCRKAEQHCAAAQILWQAVDTTTSQMQQEASIRTSNQTMVSFRATPSKHFHDRNHLN
jgi:hypothetical protein